MAAFLGLGRIDIRVDDVAQRILLAPNAAMIVPISSTMIIADPRVAPATIALPASVITTPTARSTNTRSFKIRASHEP
ncbi:MAG: hypothetical protein ACT4P6_22025 [Gemmatimonadaceae bacterium]